MIVGNVLLNVMVMNAVKFNAAEIKLTVLTIALATSTAWKVALNVLSMKCASDFTSLAIQFACNNTVCLQFHFCLQ